MIGTGHGATLTINGQAIATALQITGGGASYVVPEMSSLADSQTRTFEARAARPPKFTPVIVQYLWETRVSPWPLDLTEHPIVLTWPLKEGDTNPATLSGTGVVNALDYPTFRTGEAMIGTLAIHWRENPAFNIATVGP